MPSPFPGMNPWLEQDALWHDFHQRILTAMSDAIADEVSPRYYVALEEHVYIHEPPEPVARFLGRPDLAIVATREPRSGASTAVLEAPVYTVLPEPMDVVRESFIEIRDTENEYLVTVLELLSPFNKQVGYERDAYIAKRRQYLHCDVNFIEIDLLRGGPRMPIEELSPCDYYVLVKRASERTRAGGAGRSGCETACRRSRFPCDPPIPTCGSICKRCCIPSTTALAIDIASIEEHPSRSWSPMMPNGRTRS